MSQSNLKKKRNDATGLTFDQASSLVAAIQNRFLHDRVRAYIDSANALIEQMGTTTEDNMKAALKDFGKQARVLDMILSIATASGYLAVGDRTSAQKIRQFVETMLSNWLQRDPDGIFSIPSAYGTPKVATHSALGRRIAGMFRHAAPQAENQEDACVTARRHFNAGDYAKALPYLRAATALDPDDRALNDQLGVALAETGDFDTAIAHYQAALERKADDVGAMVGYGMSCFMAGRDAEGLEKLKQAHKQRPNSADILVRLGIYHQHHHQLEDASIYHAQALKMEPNHAEALVNLGSILCQQGKQDQGVELIDRALRAQPNNIDFQMIKANALLAAGDYGHAWALHEYGLRSPKHRNADLLPDKPVWAGEPIDGKRLLIMVEQGLGDAIHFLRYAKLCKTRAAKVYVATRPTLIRLFKQCPYLDGVAQSFGRWKFDVQISAMSLPHVFRTTLASVPADIPYLFVPADLRAKWGKNLHLDSDPRLKIGLVWSGSMFRKGGRGDLRAARRNMHLKQFLSLFEFKNATFCNLQMGEEAKQIDELGLRNRFADGMNSVTDMLDTAAIVQNLDLVVTVDTAVAHLAGALGKPVWILSRYDADWRWLHNKPDNPWYPTARIFGQPKAGDWDSVIADVSATLREKIAAR